MCIMSTGYTIIQVKQCLRVFVGKSPVCPSIYNNGICMHDVFNILQNKLRCEKGEIDFKAHEF